MGDPRNCLYTIELERFLSSAALRLERADHARLRSPQSEGTTTEEASTNLLICSGGLADLTDDHTRHHLGKLSGADGV